MSHRSVWEGRPAWARLAAPPLLAALALLASAGLASADFPADPPNDPLYDASPLPNATNEQWDLMSPADGFDRGISVDGAWALSTGRGAVIADIDVGLRLDHPDLDGRWTVNGGESGSGAGGADRRSNGRDDDANGYVDDWRGWDFYARDNDPTSDTANSHGTNVAGVLGAATDNGLGVAGIAPGASILPLRSADNILHQGGRLAQAIVYATDRGSDAMSMSLGADSFPSSLREAVRYTHRRGVVMAVAAGNEFHFHHHYPQLMEEVLAVGGVNPNTANLAARDPNLALTATDFKVRASYSNFGPHLDVVAPVQVPTSDWNGYRTNWDGTSSATPHVAGVAALVKARAKALGLELSADEVIQIIRGSAEDLTDRGQGFHAGWDRLSGWGRVNAYEAVRRVAPGRIPPVAAISAPDWYEPLTGDVEVRGRVHGRSPTRWTLELGSGEDPSSWRPLASGAGIGAEDRVLARIDRDELGAGGHTLRLRTTDSHGNSGEGRRFFTALGDPTLVSGYPARLGTSGESSPALADIDCDGADDVVLATSDGRLSVRSGRSGRTLAGWPQQMDPAPASEPTARRIGRLAAGFVATPAVGDVSGDERPEIVVAGLDGKVYAFDLRGRALPGFPYRIGLTRPAADGRLDAAVYSSPALADLDRDGKLDIVFGGADQRIYALNGRGATLPGWPVLARDGGDAAKILSSPAIGDLDGDRRPDVVEGTGEAYGSTPSTSGRVYAYTARGRRLAGWPVSPSGIAADSIPLVGEGVPVSPSLADVDGDGDDEVAVAAFSGEPELYDGDGRRLGGAGGPSRFQFAGRGAQSPASSAAVFALGANAAFGRAQRGGPPLLFGGVVDARLGPAQLSPATPIDFEHLLGGWDASSGRWLDAFPVPVEGWTIAAAPAVADVDGDGRAEVIAGSSGNLLHARRLSGGEPPGWPKQAGGWLLASPAVGDLDGDGRVEVVAVTRDGRLFAWHTEGRMASRQWPSFRHDTHNTGNLGASASAAARGCAAAGNDGRPSPRRAADPARPRSTKGRPLSGTAAGGVGSTADDGRLPFTGLGLLALLLAALALLAAGSAARRASGGERGWLRR